MTCILTEEDKQTIAWYILSNKPIEIECEYAKETKITYRLYDNEVTYESRNKWLTSGMLNVNDFNQLLFRGKYESIELIRIKWS